MKVRLALFCVLAGLSGCRAPVAHRLPPAAQVMHPGPGVDGPGPGVMMLGEDFGGGVGGMGGVVGRTSQVSFQGPDGMMVNWDVSSSGMFDSEPLVVPGRYNFPQGAIYRLKLTSIPGREGVELYPTLEVGPAVPRTEAYLAHNAIPVVFTEEDFDQVESGNYVTKVIYLPDPEFQELALAGVETLVSTRLDPGVDPIVEADKQGAILAVVRLGNKDLAVAGGDETIGEMGGTGSYGDGYGYSANGCTTDAVPPMLAGVSAPQYGMPYVGTPIGLPGPPHIPLGHQAGLQKHVIKNHTRTHIPGPVETVKIHVKQTPGLSYPKPASRVLIHEHVRGARGAFHAPLGSKRARLASADEEAMADCEQCVE
jgi:hypothetical protein